MCLALTIKNIFCKRKPKIGELYCYIHLKSNDSKNCKELRSGLCARQNHGFEYENKVIDKYGFIKSNNYTSHFDAVNPITNIPVQIKTVKYKSELCLSDYWRNKVIDKEFILIIGVWKDSKSNITDEFKYLIKPDVWVKLFEYSADDELKKDLKEITNSRSDDKKWKLIIDKHKELWFSKEKDRLITLRLKRDHKKQKRIQTAISWSNINKLNELFNILE